MPEKLAVFGFLTFLLFAGSSARIALDPVGLPSDHVSKSSPESVAVSVSDSNIVLSAEKPKSEFDRTAANDRLPESEATQNIDVSTVNSRQRLNFARIHDMNNHFFDKTTRIPLRFVRRHPCRKFQRMFMIPRTKISYGNDVILSDKTDSFDPKAFGDDQIPTKWLEFKHNYGHRHHHHHNRRHDTDDDLVFDRENLNRLSSNHKEKKIEHKGGFMRRIRKFLKHTFD